MLRRFLVSLAFATWCFLNTWAEFAEGKVAYFARYDSLYAVAVPVVCWEIVLTVSMLVAWEICLWIRPQDSRLLHVLFLASCFVPLGIASIATLRILPFDLTPIVRKPLFWPAVLSAAAVPLGYAALRPHGASRMMRSIFLYSWPVLAIILVQAARSSLLRYPRAAYTDGPLAAALNTPPARIRVIWVIFDELSQAIAFGNRPAGLQLPNLDRLRAQSFYATSAEPPADATELSMPALILGEVVTESVPQAPGDLQLRTRSQQSMFTWSSVPNVFDTARELGYNTALVGWDHPYGRILNRSLTECYWTAGWLLSGIEEPFQPQSLAKAMWYRAKLQIAALPLIGHLPGVFPGTYQRREKVLRFSYLSDRAREIAADASIGFALIHLQIPHPPAIYNRFTGNLTAEGRIGYLDNVALVDHTLGILRQTIEEAGLWDRTALLVSADHGWRTYIWRGTPEWTTDEENVSHQDTSGIPFLLKLPGQISQVAYTKRFNTVITRHIVMDILDGKLTDPATIPDVIEHLQVEPR